MLDASAGRERLCGPRSMRVTWNRGSRAACCTPGQTARATLRRIVEFVGYSMIRGNSSVGPTLLDPPAAAASAAAEAAGGSGSAGGQNLNTLAELPAVAREIISFDTGARCTFRNEDRPVTRPFSDAGNTSDRDFYGTIPVLGCPKWPFLLWYQEHSMSTRTK